MRQNNDTPRAVRLAKAMDDAIAVESDPTLVDGVATTALWTLSRQERVQLFLDETEWGRSAYDVEFTADVASPPFSIHNGSAVTWVTTGWTGVVRRVDADTVNGVVIGVTALVVLTSTE